MECHATHLSLWRAAGSAAGAFAAHFSEKVKSNVSKAKIDADGVYNGKCCFLYANNYVPAVPYQKGMSPC